MSELAPSIESKFSRVVPKEQANAPMNDIFRKGIRDAISQARTKKYFTREEFAEAVAENFMGLLGSDAVVAKIESVAKELPDRYVAVVPRGETTFKYVSRADYRSFSHPAVLSPILAFETRDSPTPCYVGTDKFGHMAQQGYDYWAIYKIIERKKQGLGELYASAWGLWTEGTDITEERISEYLAKKGLDASKKAVERVKREIEYFITESDDIKFMNPIPVRVRDNFVLRNIAHVIGMHEKGILGTSSTGIFSYADLEANEAGFRFYLDMERDPEYLAEHFDIKDYVTCRWDEEVLRSKFSPVIEERITEAVKGERGTYFTYGLGVNYNILDNIFALSVPALFVPFDDIELRLRLGAGLPLTSNVPDLRAESRAFSVFDFLFRLSGLHFGYLNASAGITPKADPRSALEAGYEIMLLGKTSFQVGYIFDPMALSSSVGVGVLILWR